MDDAENSKTRSQDGQGPDAETVAHVRHFLAQALEHMGVSATIEESTEGSDVILELVGRDTAVVIGKKGATLEALQLLCARVARKFQRETQGSIVLDAAGYRARRERSLTRMAERLGLQAVQDNQVITLDPMSARDRRVIHMALARFPGVVTRSEGEGLERRLRIIPMPASRHGSDGRS